MTRKMEKLLYKSGTALPLRVARRFGLCVWGHPNYIKATNGVPPEDCTGANVVIRMYPGGRTDCYCAACHRSQVVRNKRLRGTI